MSRVIDQNRIREGLLSADEIQYLKQRNRLPSGYQVADTSEDQTSEEVEGEEVEEVDGDDYPEWSNEELREELRERELSTAGNKSELVARLRQDDQ